jgi:hypothetical protein
MANYLALLISALFSPFVLIPITVVATGLRYENDIADLAKWIAGGLVFLVLIPSAFLFLQIASGKVTDPHVAVREQRIKPFLVGLLSSIAGTIFLWLYGLGKPAISFAICYLANMILIVLITIRWKVSIHASVFSACVVAMAISFGSHLLFLLLLLPAIGWARIHRGKHTPAQIAVGALASSATTWIVLSAMGV